jgi:two-component system response regulator HydG
VPALASDFIGASPPIRDLRTLLPRVASSRAPVVIEGETGSGKGKVAEVLHLLSARQKKPFEVLSCGAIAEPLADSELFGHARGAFTHAFEAQAGRIERANGGTLLLDNVEDLPPSVQPKLLRALEEEKVQRLGETSGRPIDVRFIATTRVPLRRAVAEGLFRDDLFHRLSVVTLEVPPLRSRPEDIPLLAERFLDEERASGRTSAEGFSEVASRALNAHPWPGNVRELRSVVAHAAIAHRGPGPIDAADLPATLVSGATVLPATGAPVSALPPLKDVERAYIAMVLERHRGSRTESARVLGISRKSLWERCKRFSIH